MAWAAVTGYRVHSRSHLLHRMTALSGNFITIAARPFSKTGENAATALSVTTGKPAQHVLIYYSINLT
jgi:hypothetical protein